MVSSDIKSKGFVRSYFTWKETEKALVHLYQSLEFISLVPEEYELWEQVRTMLWSIVGYE